MGGKETGHHIEWSEVQVVAESRDGWHCQSCCPLQDKHWKLYINISHILASYIDNTLSTDVKNIFLFLKIFTNVSFIDKNVKITTAN